MATHPPDSTRSGTTGLAHDIAQQRQLMRGRLPAYHRVLEETEALLSGPRSDATFRARLERAWQSRTFPAYYERPLLLLAAVRADALADGAAHPLHRAVGDDAADPAAVTRAALLEAVANTRLGFWTAMSTRRVQTNETSRAIAWLFPARVGDCGQGGRPLALLDVGASAGLNLVADALPAVWTDATGGRVPVVTRPRVVARVGIDARPLDASRDDDVTWLRACIWPGETERLARLDQSMRAMRAAVARGGEGAPRLERADASTAGRRVTELVRDAPPDALVLAYQTLVAGYMPAAERAAYEQEMRAAVAAHPRGRVAWSELEVEGAPDARFPVQLRVHVRGDGPGGEIETIVIGRCGYHPATVALDTSGVARLETRLRS